MHASHETIRAYVLDSHVYHGVQQSMEGPVPAGVLHFYFGPAHCRPYVSGSYIYFLPINLRNRVTQQLDNTSILDIPFG